MTKSYLRLDEHLSVQRTENLEFKIFKKIDKILNDECHRLGCDLERQQVIRELMIELSDVLFSESIFSYLYCMLLYSSYFFLICSVIK